MKTISILGAAIAVLSTGAESRSRNLVAHQPTPTDAAVLPDSGVPPKPTRPPGLDGFQQELFRRAAGSTTPLTMLMAPDNTCGWVSASMAAAYTCGAGSTCGLVQAQKTFTGAVVCYNELSYNFRFACVDYSSYFSSSACDSLCAENTLTVKCTSKALPYCNTIAFPGGATDYWCNSIDYSTVQRAQTTWRGQTDRGTYSRITQPLSAISHPASTPNGAVSDAPTHGGDSASSGGGPSRGSTGNGDDSVRDRRKTPIGAIVGGVVGGVAAISVGIGLIALFCIRGRRKNKTAGNTASIPWSSQPPAQPNGSPDMPVTHTQAYYDGKFHGPTPPQNHSPQPPYSPNATPPQGAYHPQPSLGPSSPTASHMTDPRISQMSTTAAPTWPNGHGTPSPVQQQQQQPPCVMRPVQGNHQEPQPQQPQTQHVPAQAPVHEAPTQTGDHHRGQMHEMA